MTDARKRFGEMAIDVIVAVMGHCKDCDAAKAAIKSMDTQAAIGQMCRDLAYAADEERREVVQWMRSQLDPAEQIDERINGLIDAIERGEHWKRLKG